MLTCRKYPVIVNMFIGEKMKGLMSIRAAKALAKFEGIFSNAIEATRSNDPQVSKFLEKSFVPGSTTADMLQLAGQAVAREFG